MKIFLETYDQRYGDRIAFLSTIQNQLSDHHDIMFVSSYEEADILMSQQVSYLPNLDFCLNQKKPVIIIEVNDSASIKNNEMRKAIKNPVVKGFFKVTNFKDIENHNKPTTGERYHANFINQHANLGEVKEHIVKFTDEELLKIQCASPSFLNFRMDQVRKADGLANSNRPIDVNFAGTTDYTKNKNYVNLPEGDPKLALPLLIGMHRKWAISEIVDATKNQNLKSIIVDHKPMSQPEYWNSLYSSKVCISPWGFGAYNWRDYEAIYLGALLVKPNTDFLETYCDLFRAGENYVECDQNFANLQSVLKDCLENYNDYTPIRENALKTLNDHHDIEKIAARFAKQLGNCLK